MSVGCVSVYVCVLLAVCQASPAYNDPNILDYLSYGPQVSRTWPSPSLQFGQVSGVAAGPDDKVYIFHRAGRSWGTGSFLLNESYAHPEDGPIPDPTIVVVDANSGKNLSAMGANRFYMPHGLTLDHHGNLWVTDVALHQVMRFSPGSEDPDLVLGEKLTPGSDDTHFCKPTDVAVASNGDFFVSDGYCNNRILKFSKDGDVIKTWGEQGVLGERPGPYTLYVPHSLALIEKEDMVCVADREDSRVQCFNAGIKDPAKTGEFIRTLFPPGVIGKVYAIAYDPNSGVIYAVTNPDTNADHARGYTLSLDGRGLEEWWLDNTHESLPHDVAVSSDGHDIFVGDVHTNRAVKLERAMPLY